MNHTRSRPRRGMPLLLFFLLVTLGLSLWLGLQAVDAARSHRRTAEGVLRDYAEIAVAEYSRRVQSRFDRFFREVFEDVPWRIRRGPLPPPQVVERQLDGALRRVSCPCEDFLASASFLAFDFFTGEVEALPDSLPPAEGNRTAEVVRSTWEETPAERIAFQTAGSREGLAVPSALFFNASLGESGEEGDGRAIYILRVPLGAVAELFRSWYREESLLPEAVAGEQPNDSLLYLTVQAADGARIVAPPSGSPDMALTWDTLPRRYGGVILGMGVRPDAASSLVIGGLPRARLPLLLALMVMTVGVGVAAFLQIRKEQELTQVREDFISGVSHEFRTPLTQIRMFTELLADGKLQTEEERLRSTEVINREARRLTHLVENILHFSRMGRAPGSKGPTERIVLEEALKDLTEAFHPLAQARGSRLLTHVDPRNLMVLATRSGLHRMLANLVDNALKYGPEGQTVRISATRQERWARIVVEDEGPGIPVGERARIWDPYHRLDRDVKGEVRGSGIGLSVVAELAHSAGGAAWVEEGASGGARFVLKIPVQGDPEGEMLPDHGSDRS